MSHTDVRSVRVTATGSAGVGPGRVKGLVLTTSTGAPRLTITDGNGGSTELDLDFVSGANTYELRFASNGIRFESDIYVSAFTNITAATIIYG